MKTKLERILELSAEHPDMIFTSIGHLLNAELLMECHKDMDGKKAVGIGRTTKDDYEVNLEKNLENLIHLTKIIGLYIIILVYFYRGGFGLWNAKKYLKMCCLCAH